MPANTAAQASAGVAVQERDSVLDGSCSLRLTRLPYSYPQVSRMHLHGHLCTEAWLSSGKPFAHPERTGTYGKRPSALPAVVSRAIALLS